MIFVIFGHKLCLRKEGRREKREEGKKGGRRGRKKKGKKERKEAKRECKCVFRLKKTIGTPPPPLCKILLCQ